MPEIIDYSRFEDSKRLAMLLLSKKNIENYTPEELADDFIEYTNIILSKIEDINFSES